MAIRPIGVRALARKDILDLASVTDWWRDKDFTHFYADVHTSVLMHPAYYRALVAAHGCRALEGGRSWLDYVQFEPAVWVRRGDYSVEPIGPLSNVYTADAL